MTIQEPWIELTLCLPCANMCSYCPQQKLMDNYNGDMVISFDGYKRILENIPTNVTLNFAGFSEPFQHPEFINMVKYADKNDYKIHVNTTLIGATDYMLDAIRNIEFVEFRIHNINKPLNIKWRRWFDSNDTVEPTSRAGNLYDVDINHKITRCSRSSNYKTNVMLPNGDVVLCCCDWSCQHILGNLYKTNYNDLIRTGNYDLCKKCNFGVE